MLFILLGIVFGVISYIAGAGITHGYAKHRWPSQAFKYGRMDDSDKRVLASALWPFYWLFIWPFTKLNEVIYTRAEKQAGVEVAKNKARIAELRATAAQLKASNDEMEAAEAELDKEIARTL